MRWRVYFGEQDLPHRVAIARTSVSGETHDQSPDAAHPRLLDKANQRHDPGRTYEGVDQHEVESLPLSRHAILRGNRTREVFDRTGRDRGGHPGREWTQMRRVSATVLVLLGVCVAARDAGAQERRCGVERWPVKTLSDPDAALINFAPKETTVSFLGAIKIPEIPYPNDRRMPPHEQQVYRVHAVVDQILTESDGDWHLVLRGVENPAATMIAEIPSPACAATPAHAAMYQAARDALRRIPRRGEVIIDGVGFFDFIHNQRGRARNAFELHPVTALRRATPD